MSTEETAAANDAAAAEDVSTPAAKAETESEEQASAELQSQSEQEVEEGEKVGAAPKEAQAALAPEDTTDELPLPPPPPAVEKVDGKLPGQEEVRAAANRANDAAKQVADAAAEATRRVSAVLGQATTKLRENIQLPESAEEVSKRILRSASEAGKKLSSVADDATCLTKDWTVILEGEDEEALLVRLQHSFVTGMRRIEVNGEEIIKETGSAFDSSEHKFEFNGHQFVVVIKHITLDIFAYLLSIDGTPYNTKQVDYKEQVGKSEVDLADKAAAAASAAATEASEQAGRAYRSASKSVSEMMSWMTGTKSNADSKGNGDSDGNGAGERRESLTATVEGAASWFVKTVETYIEEAAGSKGRSKEKSFGVTFLKRESLGLNLVGIEDVVAVTSFASDECPAAKCGCISVGDSLVGVNGMEFEPGTPHGDVMKAIAEATWPLTLHFTRGEQRAIGVAAEQSTETTSESEDKESGEAAGAKEGVQTEAKPEVDEDTVAVAATDDNANGKAATDASIIANEADEDVEEL